MSGGGATFTEVDKIPLPPRSVTQVIGDPTNPSSAYVTFSGFSTCAGCDGGGHVFVTNNAGATWTDISGNLPDVPTNDLAVDPAGRPVARATLYLATDVGVFGTNDGGTTWLPLATGLPNVEVTTMRLREASRTLVAGTHGRGVVSLPLPVTSSFTLSDISPVSAASSASAPNVSLAVTGTGFTANSVVNFNATALATTFQDASDLSAIIPGSLLNSGGAAQITVTDPAQANPTNALIFTATGTGDFAFGTPSPTSATVTAGHAANYLVPVSAVTGSTTSVTLSCGGLPAGATCTFTPNPAVPGGGAINVVFNIQTEAAGALPISRRLPSAPAGRYEFWIVLSIAALLLCYLFVVLRVKSGAPRRLALALGTCALVAIAGMQSACGGGGGGGGGGGQTGTFTIVITGLAGSYTHATSVGLTVSP